MLLPNCLSVQRTDSGLLTGQVRHQFCLVWVEHSPHQLFHLQCFHLQSFHLQSFHHQLLGMMSVRRLHLQNLHLQLLHLQLINHSTSLRRLQQRQQVPHLLAPHTHTPIRPPTTLLLLPGFRRHCMLLPFESSNSPILPLCAHACVLAHCNSCMPVPCEMQPER